MVSQPICNLRPPELLFPWGLPGLGRHNHFTIAPVPDNELFLLLQSEDEPEIGLILVDPFPVFPNYRYRLTEWERQDLKLKHREDLLIYTTVSMVPKGLCTNLAAPLAINAASRLGKQLYLKEYSSQSRMPLFSLEDSDG